MSIVDLP